MKTSQEIIDESIRAAEIVRAKGFTPVTYRDDEVSLDITGISKADIFKRIVKLEYPAIFFFDLRHRCEPLLKLLYPTLHAMIGCSHPNKWHPEGDVFMHTIEVLHEMSRSYPSEIGWVSALAHDIGKTTSKNPPKHYAHEERGYYMVDDFLIEIGADIGEFATNTIKYTTRYHGYMHKIKSLKPLTFAKMLIDGYAISNYNHVIAIEHLIRIAMADKRGRSFINKLTIDLLHFDENIIEVRLARAHMLRYDIRDVNILANDLKENKHHV